MKLITVGTTPVVLLDANHERKKIKIQMQAKAVDANNTGKVYIKTGDQPTATVGANSQGEVLIQSAAIENPVGAGEIDPRWKEIVWAVADTANQTLVVEEVLEPKPVE